MIGQLRDRRLSLAAGLMLIAITVGISPVLAGKTAIIDVPNAEDLAPIDGGRWVIASSMAGGTRASGALYLIDAKTSQASRAYPIENAEPSTTNTACPGEVAANAFAPHGITVHRTAEGEEQLYVVNHGGRESIEIFAITDAPGLRWIGCVPFPSGVLGNGVSVAGDGTIYATNMGRPLDGSEASSDMGGDVLFWQPAQGWRTVPDGAMWGPNGIVAAPDGKRVFVAAWPAGKLVAIDLEAHERSEVGLPFLPDNIKWSASGTLLATGHSTTEAAVRECYISSRMKCDIPSSLAEIDPATLKIMKLRPLDFDIATTAFDIGGECWLGTARGETIGRLSGPCNEDQASSSTENSTP